MKLIIDRNRCEGYGLCAEAAPGLMHLDGDDELVLDQENVPAPDVHRAEAAVRACPVAALKAG